jgi:hypothetical protein
MKVSELIEALQEMDPDMEVIMQKDGEGNGYSPLSGADPDGIYVAESTWSGEVYDASWTAVDAGFDGYEDEWEELQKGPRACILFPVN